MGWAVALTHPNCEEAARRHIERQGFESWLPRISPKELLFPRYILVLIDGAWRSLLGTRGVADVLRTSPEAQPSQLRACEVDRLRAMQGPDGLVSLPPRFSAGDRVRLGRGAWADHVAVFQEMSGPDRAVVLLTLLGRRDVRLVVDEDDLAAA